MLEDNEGNMTDLHPFVITKEEIEKDNLLHTFTYDYSDKLASSTEINGVNIQRIKKVLVYVNAGIDGSVAQGYFWLDKIVFRTEIKK
jgi:hypothetical protein